ncbi:MAG: hypothetical protein BWY15_01988 [Firmicutes bacterium ADurb.Bin193]|nr:MAG: hypothetical protein BWY15_01988 [Firmicutes bacterium ADurb.Bin193]
MRRELKHNNTVGDINGINYFAEVILSQGETDYSSAQSICSFVNGIRLNFSCAVAFFEYLEIVNYDNVTIVPTDTGKELSQCLNTDKFTNSLCELCIKKIVNDGIVDISAVHFDPGVRTYFVEKYGFPVWAALFRNTLILLGAIVESENGRYYFQLSAEKIFTKLLSKKQRKISIEMLNERLKIQQEQGELAEEYVVRYEMKRIYDNPYVGDVKRISDIDVSAGYDIVSFESKHSQNYDRFIEVKSYIGKPHFYWSRNELEVAKAKQEQYYIYLIDSERMSEDDYVPKIIRNPANSIFESDSWIVESSAYYIVSTE